MEDTIPLERRLLSARLRPMIRSLSYGHIPAAEFSELVRALADGKDVEGCLKSFVEEARRGDNIAAVFVEVLPRRGHRPGRFS